MNDVTKRLIIGALAFVVTAAIFWAGGMDIERGLPLAWALIISLMAAGMAASFPFQG